MKKGDNARIIVERYKHLESLYFSNSLQFYIPHRDGLLYGKTHTKRKLLKRNS
jgi:hypothetical protein